MSFMKRLYEIDQRVTVSVVLEKPPVPDKITGYSCDFPVMYIVLLDSPLDIPGFEGWTGVAVPGSILEQI